MNKTLERVKRFYWSALAGWQRWRHPSDTVLTPHDWMRAIQRFVPPSEAVIYVDGGAHDGRMIRKFRDHYARLQAYGFEPNADLLPALERAFDGADGRAVPAALGPETGRTSIHINASPMTSSLLPRSERGALYFDAETRLRETRSVPVTTLDGFIRSEGLARIDILKLDLQGYELEALRGATVALRCGVSCVFIEVNFVPLYEGSALFSDVDLFMRERGYRLHNLYDLSTKNIDGRLNGGNALYVPADHHPSRLRLRPAA